MSESLKRLDGTPSKPGFYWSCEGYSPSYMDVYYVSNNGGHNRHEISFSEAANMDCEWWGPIQSPQDPELYGDQQ